MSWQSVETIIVLIAASAGNVRGACAGIQNHKNALIADIVKDAANALTATIAVKR